MIVELECGETGIPRQCMDENQCSLFRWEFSSNCQGVKCSHFVLAQCQDGYIPTRKQQYMYKGIHCNLPCNCKKLEMRK